MGFLGQELNNTVGDLESEVRERIRQLWDLRLLSIAQEPESHKSEASAFVRTFASAKLDDDWALAGLETTLLAGCPGVLGHDVIGRLAQIACTKPVEATRFTLDMLEGSVNEWGYLTWRDQVRDVLVATDKIVDPETVENRAGIVDHYIKRGDLDFREFAPRATEL